MSPLAAEKAAVQDPLVRYAEEAGWTRLAREEALALRGGEGGMVLRDVLLSQLRRLNPGVMDEARAEDVLRRLTRVAPSIEGILAAWQFIKGLQTEFVEEERRERHVRLLDPDVPEANSFHVTDELAYTLRQRRAGHDRRDQGRGPA